MYIKLTTKMPPEKVGVKGVKTSRIVKARDAIALPQGSFSVVNQTLLTKFLNILTSPEKLSGNPAIINPELFIMGSGDILVKGVKSDVKAVGVGFAKIKGAKNVRVEGARRAYAFKNESAMIDGSERTSRASYNKYLGSVSGTKDGDGIATYNGKDGHAMLNAHDGIASNNCVDGVASGNKRNGYANFNGRNGNVSENGQDGIANFNGRNGDAEWNDRDGIAIGNGQHGYADNNDRNGYALCNGQDGYVTENGQDGFAIGNVRNGHASGNRREGNVVGNGQKGIASYNGSGFAADNGSDNIVLFDQKMV